MTIELYTLTDVYETMMKYVPTKDRQELSDSLVSDLMDMLSEDDLKKFCSSSSYLKKSYKHYVYDDDHEELHDDDEDDDY